MISPLEWPVYHHATLDSTSDEARRMVEAAAPVPFVVRADRQTKGRGRGANSWWSDDGSILFTVAFDPSACGLQTRHEPRLALIAALAVINTLDGLADSKLDAKVRWPNDVELGGRKVAGILPERVETPGGHRILLGVGINGSTRFDGAPEDVRSLAISLTDLKGSWTYSPGLTDLVDPFLREFGVFLPYLAEDDPRLVEWINHFDALAGRAIRIQQGARVLEGIARGIDAEGALRLETDRGIETIVGGQVLRDA
jgi:BirA family biotin operon repressor/biotin-[acetyl-CoA-carboxylase] ligase